jgi:magnesium-transporting ATPase (P-type)
LLEAERFSEKTRDPSGQSFSPGLNGAAHEDHGQLRATGAQYFHHLQTIHHRHRDVRQNQANCALRLFQQGHGFGAVRGGQDPVTVLRQRGRDNLTDRSVVVDEEYPFAVVQGQGFAEVQAIGAQTEIGKIGKSLRTVESEETLLQKETGRLVTRLAVWGLGLCVVVVVAYGLTRGNWLQGVLAGLTLGMALLPEEFPVVLTIFLALGAWRISRNRVLTRRVPAIETLGSATVLCTDKTGTLTMNQMMVVRLQSDGIICELGKVGAQALPEESHELVEFGILASQRDPFDPMEKAIQQVGSRFLLNTEHLHQEWELVRHQSKSCGLCRLLRRTGKSWR